MTHEKCQVAKWPISAENYAYAAEAMNEATRQGLSGLPLSGKALDLENILKARGYQGAGIEMAYQSGLRLSKLTRG